MKKNNNQNKPAKSRGFYVIVVILLLAFISLLLANLFSSKSSKEKLPKKKITDVYKFKKQGELTFQSSSGEYKSQIDIEFADNEYERSQGLMYRTEMGENQGMLFIFPTQTYQSFWMKNTVISLDMIFINSVFEIVTIHQNTEPYSLNSYPSSKPAQYVLETIAGYCARHNIQVGDKVIFRKTN